MARRIRRWRPRSPTSRARYVALGRLPEAAEASDRALAIDSALFPPSAPALAIRHSNRGELERNQRAVAAASARYLRAAAIFRPSGPGRCGGRR